MLTINMCQPAITKYIKADWLVENLHTCYADHLETNSAIKLQNFLQHTTLLYLLTADNGLMTLKTLLMIYMYSQWIC